MAHTHKYTHEREASRTSVMTTNKLTNRTRICQLYFLYPFSSCFTTTSRLYLPILNDHCYFSTMSPLLLLPLYSRHQARKKAPCTLPGLKKSQKSTVWGTIDWLHIKCQSKCTQIYHSHKPVPSEQQHLSDTLINTSHSLTSNNNHTHNHVRRIKTARRPHHPHLLHIRSLARW